MSLFILLRLENHRRGERSVVVEMNAQLQKATRPKESRVMPPSGLPKSNFGMIIKATYRMASCDLDDQFLS